MVGLSEQKYEPYECLSSALISSGLYFHYFSFRSRCLCKNRICQTDQEVSEQPIRLWRFMEVEINNTVAVNVLLEECSGCTNRMPGTDTRPIFGSLLDQIWRKKILYQVWYKPDLGWVTSLNATVYANYWSNTWSPDFSFLFSHQTCMIASLLY